MAGKKKAKGAKLAKPMPENGGREPSDEQVPRRKSVFREYAETIVICVLALVFLQNTTVMRSKVPTGSMIDSLLVGDYILINRNVFGAPGEAPLSLVGQRPIERGDVLVFRSKEDPELDLVKRVVALPNETIEIVRGQVFIDGDPLDEPYVRRSQTAPRSNMRPVTIPEDEYFMMGDNRGSSRDSRVWGPVPRPLVKGRAFLIWWSYEEERNSHLNTGFDAVVAFLKKIPRVPTKTRWDRLFKRIE